MKNNSESKIVAIIGGGPAGLETASQLKFLGYKPVLIEKNDKLGGHLNNWHNLFPDGIESKKVLKELIEKVKGIKIFLNAEISDVDHERGNYIITLKNNEIIKSDSVVISTGFDLFPAEKKEEYGYKIYKNVITSNDLESHFKSGFSNMDKNLSKIGFVHCVGSRDEKVCNRHCSKVCCITAVKQAIEIKERYPESEVYCFYMDLRMFGRGYEDLYYDAQSKYGIRFIRGRVSEVSENIDSKVVIKAEDTLQSRPIKITLDMLVLMVGMNNCSSSQKVSEKFELKLSEDGFFENSEKIVALNSSNRKGIFFAGTSTGPKTIPETLNDARGTALLVHHYLLNQ